MTGSLRQLVVVANRLPVEIGPDGDVRVSPVGVASALSSLRETSHWGTWAGAGSGYPTSVDHGQLRSHPVELSQDEVQRYYCGFSNSVLWPVFHGGIRAIRHDRSWFGGYRAVNERFATTVDDINAIKTAMLNALYMQTAERQARMRAASCREEQRLTPLGARLPDPLAIDPSRSRRAVHRGHLAAWGRIHRALTGPGRELPEYRQRQTKRCAGKSGRRLTRRLP